MYILDIFNVTNWLFVLGRVNDKCVGENDNCHVGLPVSILPISFLYLFVAYLGVQNKVPHTQTKPLEHTACNSVPPAPTSQTTHLGSNTHQNPRTSCTHSPNLVDVYPSLYDISCQFVSKPYQNTWGICLSLPQMQSDK